MKYGLLLIVALFGCAAGGLPPTLAAAPSAPAAAAGAGPAGSTAFCLFALPPESGLQRWINLGIVQYVEARADLVVIAYGGGNLGGGYEAKIAVKNADEAQTLLTRLRQTAEDCSRRPTTNPSPEDKR